MAHSLLIIGNGFDKHCGLLSNFSDYYRNLLKNNDSILKVFYDYMLNDSNYNLESLKMIISSKKDAIIEAITIWDLYFFANMDVSSNSIRWFNVEQDIYNSFHIKVTLGNISAQNFWKYFLMRYQSYTRNIKTITSKFDVMILTYYYLNHYSSKFKKVTREYFKNSDSFNLFLKTQLEKFEQNFRDYLKPISQKPEYLNKKFDLINKLKVGTTNVLNFNYTTVPMKGYEHSENVHGTLDRDLSIIGIDGSYMESISPAYQFTKTYRKLERFTVDPIKPTASILDQKMNNIIFYGHSLNKQDYAYFQAIFDYFDLYGHKKDTPIKLYFFYSIFDRSREDQIKKEAFINVMKLIETYDKDLISNHDKSKNLLHQLLIENRIFIRELD